MRMSLAQSSWRRTLGIICNAIPPHTRCWRSLEIVNCKRRTRRAQRWKSSIANNGGCGANPCRSGRPGSVPGVRSSNIWLWSAGRLPVNCTREPCESGRRLRSTLFASASSGFVTSSRISCPPNTSSGAKISSTCRTCWARCTILTFSGQPH